MHHIMKALWRHRTDQIINQLDKKDKINACPIQCSSLYILKYTMKSKSIIIRMGKVALSKINKKDRDEKTKVFAEMF